MAVPTDSIHAQVLRSLAASMREHAEVLPIWSPMRGELLEWATSCDAAAGDPDHVEEQAKEHKVECSPWRAAPRLRLLPGGAI